jgi:hypothetical protein
MLSKETKLKILDLKRVIVAKFSGDNWSDIGLLTDFDKEINSHHRLLRSMRFADDDYGEHVGDILTELVSRDPHNLQIVQDYLDERFGEPGTYISTVPSQRKITFSPAVFSIPEIAVDDSLVAVMMPFSGFDSVLNAIRSACDWTGLCAQRVDDIWDESVIVQDVFNLIFRSKVVVCDLTGKNPNVFYEMGIAHTLGKVVVPIAQSIADVPSDLQHHRTLLYLNNGEGLKRMEASLGDKLRQLTASR